MFLLIALLLLLPAFYALGWLVGAGGAIAWFLGKIGFAIGRGATRMAKGARESRLESERRLQALANRPRYVDDTHRSTQL